MLPKAAQLIGHSPKRGVAVMAVPKEFARRALNLVDFIPIGAGGQAAHRATPLIADLCLVLQVTLTAITDCNQSVCVKYARENNPDFMPGFLTGREPLRTGDRYDCMQLARPDLVF
jgi:hypothetical protein